jgi:hypothetical protein
LGGGPPHLAEGDAMAENEHRVMKWTGVGWWRRRACVKHAPRWRSIATSGYADLQICDGDGRCTVTRTVRNADFQRIWGELL